MDKGSGGLAAPLVYFRISGLEPVLRLRGNLRIPQRRTVIRCALKNREMGDFFGNYRNQLDRRGARADDRDALACKVHLCPRPAGGVIRLALEAIDTLEWRYITGGED